MGKIICKVCGSSYPDTAEQCPFCGYVNPENSQAAMGDGGSSNTNGTYHYVKGGRFSKSNVKKRNQGKIPEVHNTTTEKIAAKKVKPTHENKHSAPEKHNGKKPVGIIVVSVILILAIIAVVIYLSMQFFGPNHNILPDGTTVPSTTASATETEPQIPECESITLNVSNITFEKVNASRMLYVSTNPEKVAETPEFTSSNEEVATVSQNGMVTAVGPGEAIITVTCGNAKAQCVVSCNVPEETTEPEETTVPEESTVSAEEFKLNRKDMTFSRKGDTWVLYDGDIGKTQIKFSSDNPAVATFEGGTVKAVGKGTTTVHAEYMGKKISCIVRCSFSESSGVEGNGGGVSEDVGQTSGGNYRICTVFGDSHGDITLASGKSLELFLKDDNGNVAKTSWQVDGSGVAISGSTIKRVSSGTCVVSTTYNGKTYKLFVR